MSKSPGRFAQLLTRAIRRIALQENSKIQIVQDELGYALGRDSGGAAIEYWRKQHVPAREADVDDLARELVRRGGLTNHAELEQFLFYADLPNPAALATEILAELGHLAETGPARFADDPFMDPDSPPLDEHPAFLAGPPITQPRFFFGRERELKRLFNLLKHRPLQNAAIIGPRRSGKTSLLHYLAQITVTPSAQLRPNQRRDWLARPEPYRWLLVDFQDTRLGSQAGLLHYLLSRLDLPIPEPCNLDRFMDIVSEELRQPTAILLDEIGVALQRYPELDDSFWEGLRALATHQVDGNLAFVLAAPEPPNQLARHSDLGSPFFNIFGYTASLGPLQEAEAHDLIASSPRSFPAEDVDWIIEQSGAWPILLQILCRERLIALEEGETGRTWRDDGLQQIAPFRRLLA